MRQYCGIWFPDDDGGLTRALKARLDNEPVYHGDRLAEALRYVTWFRTAVECGANVGMWTRELARHFGKVVAIEPAPANCECLKANTAELQNVTLVECALGAEEGTCGLEMKKGHFSATVVRESVNQTIPMIPLDALRIENCDYIKMHVNGYELETLQGAVATLARCAPVLTVVLKPKLGRFGHGPGDVIDWLAEKGYRMAGGQKPYRIFTPL